MKTLTERNAFTRGYGIAAAELARSHNEDTLAYYLVAGACFSYADFVRAGLEEYDLCELRKIYALHDDLPASVDRSPEGGDHEDGRHAKHESAVGEAETPNG